MNNEFDEIQLGIVAPFWARADHPELTRDRATFTCRDGIPVDLSFVPDFPDDWRPVFCAYDNAPVYLTPTNWLVMVNLPQSVDAGHAPRFRAWPAAQYPALLFYAHQDLDSLLERVSSEAPVGGLDRSDVFSHNASVLGVDADLVNSSLDYHDRLLSALEAKDWEALSELPYVESEDPDNDAYWDGEEAEPRADAGCFLLPVEVDRILAMGQACHRGDLVGVAKPYAKYQAQGYSPHLSWIDIASDAARFWVEHGFCPPDRAGLIEKIGGVFKRNLANFSSYSDHCYLDCCYPEY